MIEFVILDALPIIMHTIFYVTIVVVAICAVIWVIGELIANGIHDD